MKRAPSILIVLALVALFGVAAVAPFVSVTTTTSGTLRTPTNLWTANSNGINAVLDLSSRSATGHTHAASDLSSGQLAMGRIASGTGSTSNYVRGDGTLAQVSTNDVPGLVAALATIPGVAADHSWGGVQSFSSLSLGGVSRSTWPGLILVGPTSTTVTNSTAETELLSVPVPAGGFDQDGRELVICSRGVLYNDTGSGDQLAFSAYVNGLCVYTNRVSTGLGATAGQPQWIDAEFVLARTNATTVVGQWMMRRSGSAAYTTNSIGTAGTGTIYLQGIWPAAWTSASSNTLSLRFSHSISGAASWAPVSTARFR